ncbi:MAG: D-2-hydroxyacid dehydrogenase [Acidobacteriota bacterium]|nr:D-2-hydroxyacid dehydrogenase [Acidobacteriota bacterium]
MKSVALDGYVLNPGDLSWSGIEQLTTLKVYDRTARDLIVPRARDAAIILTAKTPLAAETLRQLESLRYIGVLATGYDNVDVRAAREMGIAVANIPAYGTESVAQFVFALLLELCHRIAIHGDAVRAGEWSANPDWSFWKTPLVELAGKTMGIVGFGRIGRQVARIANAMGMRVIANDESQKNPPGYPGFQWASVDDLLRASDVVTLHCPLLPETKWLIDAGRLRGMKPNAFFINTSRGALVVDQDLADALNEGRLAGAALDVLATEPPSPGNPLFTARNCVVTPHIAWATKEARTRLMQAAVQNVAAFLDGKPKNIVNP